MHGTLVDVKVITDAVRLACRAPSLHNSQPWRLDRDGKGVHLFLDTSRIMPSTDRSAREAIISCGALLDHLRVAMAAAGWKAHVDRFPNPNNLDHLASIEFMPMKLVTEAHRRRADVILLRRTDRLPFAAPTEWESFEPLLRLAFDTDAVRLDVMSDEVRGELAEMSKLTDSLRLYDSAYHSELYWRTASFEFSEGIPYSKYPKRVKRCARGGRGDRRFMGVDQRRQMGSGGGGSTRRPAAACTCGACFAVHDKIRSARRRQR